LPDSTTNEPASHGFVRFSLTPENPLVYDDSVVNRVGIYFDYNAPIITNETVLRIVLSVGTYTPSDGLHFTVSPNPAIDRLRLSAPGGLPSGGRAVLYDALQRPALHQTLPGGETLEMNLSTLPAGVFVLVLYDASGRIVGAKKVEKF
jgi:hypothetical protein